MPDKESEPLDDVEGLAKKIGTVKKAASPAGGNDGKAGKSPAGAPAESPSTSGGDFSLLMKKLGMGEKKAEVPGPAASPLTAPPAELRDDQQAPAVITLDDLLEEEELPALAAPDIPSAAEPAVEIADEDPRRSPWKKKPKLNATADPARQPQKEPGTDAEEKIISVDQISDLSGLILPKSATFAVEELKLHSRVSAYDGQSIGSLPDEFDEIWKKELSKVGFKDLDLGDVVAGGETKAPTVPKKFSIGSLFAAIRTEEEEYDAKKHGPLIDLAFTPRPGIEEIEMYPVNEPYAYVRIIYDHATHEYTYNVIEPVLAEQEKDLLKEVKERLFETLDINTKDITREEARHKLREATNDVLQDYGIRLTPVQKEKLHYNMHKDFLGDGLIDPVMHDKYIEDISCDGVHTPIFAFHSSYESMKTTLAYHSAEELDSFVTKLAQRAGKYISIAEPILDATMQDGSRIQMTLGTEVTAHGSTFTIRKFKDEPITPTDLIEWHTFAPLSIAYIWLAVENGKSAIFAGGTASGKTTALNAISLFIPPMAKIVSLEDTREVKLPHPNWIPSVTRDSFDTAGRGEINMYELLRAAMRQRPEYIIVGEVRGKECQTLFQAMSTGHITYSTTHADSVASVVHRIENPPMDVPRNMLSALDFICVQVQARVGGKRIRRNKQIVEILDIDPRTNELITNEVFKWRSATDEHTYSGKSYLLEEIMEAKGWDEGRMREELKRRQEVLEWMRIKKIRHYKDVAKTLISYHRDPETVIEKVRKDLYE
ncbi:type II/IV secretion system ATPase subunit [Methanoregula sp.]|uniref:type II/IV secretion system ATPase subunit n=1 Tax=Methanoregula sp. TaxID=2052170 RepID=UPI000CB89187|nr:type II/IV secretion system ATPase subunit [Methanoregula sp.]PKG33978.1 MAG: secretion system protein E [Methanoregula sp.]